MRKLVVALAFMGLTGAALAKEAKRSDTYQPKPMYLPFDDDEVIATGIGPDGFPVDAAVHPKHLSLLKPRDSFKPELLKSAENL
jgi:hypothetical protein